MSKPYDFLIVGAGFFGSICARELTNQGYSCLVIEKRDHIGGNCYTEKRDDIHLHVYGAHIFHTSNEKVWKWINQYAKFNHYTNRPIANYKGELFALPFNMWTFNQLWNVNTPEEAQKIIAEQGKDIQGEPKNLEEQAIKKNCIAITGASTLPCLSSAVLNYYKDEFKTIDSLVYGITIGQKTERGLATFKSILSYAGHRLQDFRGISKKMYGWQDLYRQEYPLLGKRWMANCDVPDLDLLPGYFPIKSIRFSAGISRFSKKSSLVS